MINEEGLVPLSVAFASRIPACFIPEVFDSTLRLLRMQQHPLKKIKTRLNKKIPAIQQLSAR